MHTLRSLFYPFVFPFLILLTFYPCLANTTGNTDETTATVCQEPRPEICTMDYRPVCAKLKSGGYKTYANGCNACSDPNVISYVNKACKAEEER